MPEATPQSLEVGKGVAARRIAVIAEAPRTPGDVGLLWLSGFKSDMASTKASALAAWARERGLGCTQFDYSGHGMSGGRFEDGTIGGWLEEAEAVMLGCTAGPQVVIGSSMGGYIALLLLKRLMAEQGADAARIAGLMLIAPAWDMTEALMWAAFPEAARRQVETEGVFLRPSLYGDPYPITRGLIEDGRRHLIGGVPFDPGRPVRILHGRLDPDVPYRHTEELLGLLAGGHAEVTAIDDGEHRLSRPEDLQVMFRLIGELVQRARERGAA